MNLAKFSIDNHHFMLIAVLILIVLGTVSFFTMPKSEDPAVSIAGSNVIAIYSGGSPADMEELVIEPVEEALNEPYHNGCTEIAVEPNLAWSIKTASVRAVFIPLIFKFVFVYYDQFQFLHE